MALRFTAPDYQSGRRCLRCGAITVGAIFPPIGAESKWRWRVWVNGRTRASEGSEKSELAAKSAAIGCFRTFLQQAGLMEAAHDQA